MKKPKRLTNADIKLLRLGKLEINGGDTDGVFFLGSRMYRSRVLVASCELSAIPLLKRPSKEWLEMHPGQAGISTSIGFNFFAPQELMDLSEKEGRPLRHLLKADCEGTESPFDASNAYRWRVEKFSARIYLVYFDKAKEIVDNAFDS